VDEAVRIATAVANALDHAHRNKVIHRDIKPANILLQDGEPVVADFGIALAVGAAGGSRLTETGLSVGTPWYMSPEQATGDQPIGASTDTYALGSVLYEMLVGEPPYPGTTAQAVLGKIIAGKPVSATEQRPAIPANVDAAVRKALEKLPADRFTSAQEFVRALGDEHFRYGEAVAGVSGATTGPWNRLTMATTAGAVLFALAFGWSLLRPGPPNPVIQYTLAFPEGEGLLDAFGTSLALSPDGSRLVYVGIGDQDQQLWIRQRDQLSVSPLPGTDGGHQPFFAPDGQRVGFVTLDRALKVVSLTGEPPTTLVESGLSRTSGAWGVDGYVYFRLIGYGGMMRVPTTGGGVPEPVPTPDTTRQPADPTWPDVLPSGKGLLLTVGGSASAATESDSVAVMDLATGEHRVLVQGILGRYAASGHLVYMRQDGALLAAPFDQDKLILTGPPVALLGEVAVRPGPDLALSQTGRLVYASGREAREVVWVDRDGTARPIDPDWTGAFESVALSPDGTRLAATLGTVGETAVWIKQLDRGPASLLTFTDGLNRRPAWTPDGLSVTFISNRGGNRDLYAKRADGVGSAEPVLDLAVDVDEGLWSPHGDWLVYRTGTVPPERDIFAWRSGPDSATISVVADSAVDVVAPALSPDGRWLAYVSDETGRQEVWVVPFPDVEAGRWQVSVRGGTEPLWAHSGRELFYKSQGSLMVVGVQTDPTFATLEVRELFSTRGYFPFIVHRSYDVAADDQRFVMIRSSAAGVNRLVVVENFFEELKRLVPN